MQDQVGLDLDNFPLDHVFSDEYSLKEEDEVDINREPLFEDELANQAIGVQPKRKNRRTKACTVAEETLFCGCWRDIWQDPKVDAKQKASTFWIRVHHEFHERKKFPPYQMQITRIWVSISKRWMAFQAFEAFKVQHKGKPFNLFHYWRIIKDEEKFKLQYAALTAHGGGEEALEEVGEGEKPRSRGKTNSKKEDKRDAASIALIATVEGMMTKKDSGEEKRRQDKEEQMNAFMKIQRSRLDMEAEKQAKMLEMEAKKQAKMLEIEAANANTKAKEVALASMMTGVEIMKVDLNTVSPRKRPWFEKMQGDMLKFDDE
ncbi:Lectin-domain containing receptor kinase A4.3 [Hordeum vulgare]|nr:Lectin-domain containing receptor kinase A4.3 [Hordeum vulgare]